MRKAIVLFLVVALFGGVNSISYAGPTPKAGGSCTKVNQVFITNGVQFICIKSGNKLVWNKGTKVANPNPSPIATKVSTPAIAEGDDQFFYGTYGCKNKLMFVRYNRKGEVLRQNQIIAAIENYQLIPKFYLQGTLLFKTFDCTTNMESLYTMDISNTNTQPQLIYGPTSNTIMDATIDVASKTPLILISSNGSYQVVTGGLLSNLIWSSSSTPGFSPNTILTQTGYQFLVFGNYGCCGTRKGFGGYLVDIKQKYTQEFAYTPNLYLLNGHSVKAGGGWNNPLAFSTEAGVYLCGSPGQYPLNIQTDTRCGLVTSKSLNGMSMAISYGPNNSYDLIAGDSIYNYPFSSSFLSYSEKPIITRTFQNLGSLIFNNDYVSTFEITSDLGSMSKSWNYYGTYFAQN